MTSTLVAVMSLAILISSAFTALSAGSPPASEAGAPTAKPDFSMYPCTVPPSTGISLVSLDRKTAREYALTFAMPLDEAAFFRGYVYEIRGSSHELVATVRGSDAVVQKDRNDLAIRILSFRTVKPISTYVFAIETYPNAGCKFTNIALGRATLDANTTYSKTKPMAPDVDPTSPGPTPNPLFQTVLPVLKSGTSVPILLPTDVAFNTAAEGPLYAELDSVSRSGYSIDFDTAPGCNGAGVCIAGYMSSFPASGSINTSTFASTQTVKLQNGAKAIAAIPQYRVPTLITWDSNGRRYVIALGVPHFPQDLVTMANSMTAF
jgi:hypothetical protein